MPTLSAIRYAQVLKRKWSGSNLGVGDKVILIEAVDSFPIIQSFSYISNILARKENSSIRCYDFENKGVPNYFLRYLYNAFGAKENLSWKEGEEFREKSSEKANKLYRKISSKNDLVSLKLDGLLIGDLIYDTYLRKESKFTVELNDERLLNYIYEACFLYYTVKNYFEVNSVLAVLPGDVAYIYAGILARYAVSKNINVFTIVEGDGLLLNKMDDFYYRRRPFWKYKNEFLTFSKKMRDDLLVKADHALTTRVSGKHANLSYMTKSSFSEVDAKKVLSTSSKPKILILLHCFFDSPHIYRSLLFPDFYEWITFLLTKASETEFEWYVKPHPNGLPGNEKVTQVLIDKFPDITFLPSSTSNLQIYKEGIQSVFTGYGTAGHEFAFLNVPVVNAGDNPHIAYSFNLNPQSLEEYIVCIESADNLNIEISKEEVKEFYAMHYLYSKSCKQLQPVYPSNDIKRFIGVSSQVSSKLQRTKYHKSNKTLDYFVESDSKINDDEIINCVSDLIARA